jgi:hypothetical protein
MINTMYGLMLVTPCSAFIIAVIIAFVIALAIPEGKRFYFSEVFLTTYLFVSMLEIFCVGVYLLAK